MKKWIASLGLAGLAFSLSGCTTAVMTYVKVQRTHHGYLIERTRDQVKACLGQPKSTQRINGIELWQYNYRADSQNICMVEIYFKGRKVKDTRFSQIGTRGTPGTACQIAKEKYKPCLKHYLVFTK